MNLEFKKPSISMDELWDASPCNWCLLQSICFEYCTAKMDWLRIFHGQDTFKDLRELLRRFPTSTSARTTVSYGCALTNIERNMDDNGSISSDEMRGMSRKGNLLRSLRRRISQGFKRIL